MTVRVIIDLRRLVCATGFTHTLSFALEQIVARFHTGTLLDRVRSVSCCSSRSGRAVAQMSSNQQKGLGDITKAMALRVKYRVDPPRKRLSVELVAPHPYNRAGAYPSGNRAYLLAYGADYTTGVAVGTILGMCERENIGNWGPMCQRNGVYLVSGRCHPSPNELIRYAQDVWVFNGTVFQGVTQFSTTH